MNTAPGADIRIRRSAPRAGAGSSRQPALACIAASLLAIGAASGPAWCAPQDGVVRAGAATITQSGTRTAITQSSQRAVIDWRSFGIDAGEHVNFAQPSASASALNRVTGDQVSRILGQLSANGQVILVNPNGIVFGRAARVDVGSLIATTSRIGDDRLPGYMERGVLEFEPGRPGTGIVHSGIITAAEGGLVALVAPHVRNDGFIQARLGKVTLASGDRFTIDLAGDGLVSLALSDAHAGQLTDADGRIVTALVDQAGHINVRDGQAVLLAAGAARAIVDDVINMSGVIQADAATRDAAGGIVLEARGGAVAVSGQLLARGSGAGQRGGAIAVRTGELRLAESAYFDAGGVASAGTVALNGLRRIGGTEAEVVSRSLRTGSHTTLASPAAMEISSSIDGRGGVARGGLSVEAVGDVVVNRDLLTASGAVRLASAAGAITINEQAAPIDGGRVHPIVFAGDASITLRASGAVLTGDLITSGDISITSTNAQVAVGASLGYSFNGPIGSLAIDAQSSNPDSPGDVMLMDVQVAPGGAVSISAFRNIQLFLPGGEPPFGLLASGNVSFQSVLMGDLWNNPFYPDLAGALFLDPGPDGDWTTLGDNLFATDTLVPGITPPGPTENLPPLLPLQEIAAIELPEVVLAPTEVPPAELLPPPGALLPFPPNTEIEVIAPSLPSAPAIAADDAQDTDALVPLPLAPASDALRMAGLQDGAPGPASGGRGVARDADLGRAAPRGVASDVFEQPTHVVEAPLCELDNGAINTYFGSDAFGQALAVSCQ